MPDRDSRASGVPPPDVRVEQVLARARRGAAALDEALDALAGAPGRARAAARDRSAVLDDLTADLGR